MYTPVGCLVKEFNKRLKNGFLTFPWKSEFSLAVITWTRQKQQPEKAPIHVQWNPAIMNPAIAKTPL